jgi:hypothetical protein
MKSLLFALCVMSAFGSLRAQKPVWQPSPGHTQIPIWPGAAPDRSLYVDRSTRRRPGTTFFPAVDRRSE